MKRTSKNIAVPLLGLAVSIFMGQHAYGDEVEELLRQINLAKGTVRVPTDDDLAAARVKVIDAERKLEAYLATLPLGQSMKASLGLEAFTAEVNRSPVDAKKLGLVSEPILAKSSSSPAHQALHEALLPYLLLSHARFNPLLGTAYDRGLEAVAEALSTRASNPTPESQARLREAFEKLPRVPGGTPLRLAIRRKVSHVNQVIVASDEFLNDEAARQKIDIKTPVSSMTSGTRIRGEAQTNGKVKLVLHPNDQMAQIEVQFQGTTASRLTGSKGPVNVFERGTANLYATETGFLSPAGVQTAPASAQARNDIRPYAVQVNLRSRLLRRIVTPLAWRLAWKQKPTADSQANSQIKTQLESQLAEATVKALEEVNQFFQRFYPPSGNGDSRAPRLEMRTTSTHLHWGAEFAAPWQLGAPSAPPAGLFANATVLAQIHESAVNNTAGGLAGRTVNEPDFRELIFDTLALTPDDTPAARGRIPAKIVLADRDPIKLSLKDGRVSITCRIKAFESQARRYEGARTITMAYEPKVGDKGAEVARVGSILVEPSSVSNQPDLAAILTDAIPARATTQGQTIFGEMGASHDLRVAHLSVADGWLNVAWQHKGTSAVAKTTPPTTTANTSAAASASSKVNP